MNFRSRPLQEALDLLQVEFPTDRALSGELAADVLLALATTDLDDVLVDLLTLATDGQLEDRYAFEIFDLLRDTSWIEWDMPAVQAIVRWADAWWLTALRMLPELADAGAALGQLVHLDLGMVKWLRVWLDELDGYGAQHLANFLIEGSDHPGWNGYDDERAQVRAWAQSETVVNGFTMIGGVHLEEGRMTKVLEEIVVTPGLPRV